MFWDGRALDTVEQAKGPFLNPLEMNNPDPRSVVIKVLRSDYAELFTQVYMGWKLGGTLTPDAMAEMKMDVGSRQFVADAYQLIAESISAYEGSSEVNRFSSKYDAYLAGTAMLTPQETWGLQLFEGKGGAAAAPSANRTWRKGIRPSSPLTPTTTTGCSRACARSWSSTTPATSGDGLRPRYRRT